MVTRYTVRYDPLNASFVAHPVGVDDPELQIAGCLSEASAISAAAIRWPGSQRDWLREARELAAMLGVTFAWSAIETTTRRFDGRELWLAHLETVRGDERVAWDVRLSKEQPVFVRDELTAMAQLGYAAKGHEFNGRVDPRTDEVRRLLGEEGFCRLRAFSWSGAQRAERLPQE